ncbi:serine/threonine-protein kinase [Archangium gephyra]|uniref:Serine/threonine kinase Pkn10 n=1 Tax=Archangium gephyra TaxID=48 RepID=A0AAC8QAI4_9BACT|nr:serine/threonine-protein kinase [Archangium gephyra]AKJ04150.1 Serine/threonine kinase Pkn10 [Archangium gephyra]REG37766.1 serine/threonine-protein kinase [Archangium gephyra]
MKTLNCPSCARAHDVSGLAEGHEVACACGARFPVRAAPASELEPVLSAPTLLRPSLPSAGTGLEQRVQEAEDTGLGGAVELPGYELVRVLGRGGMGEVWLARQKSLHRMVAVKVLPPRLAKDPEFVTRFDKEATALAALNHPNIVQIIDRGVAGDHYYFVMEYVEGRSLREVMRELSPPEALRLALQVARAIECAHDKDIIHRDLKPENILLDGRGLVKVADFGLAGIRRPDSRLQLTATAVAMGTLNYMAPEQRRDAKNVDGRADLFSFGVVLYEMLTGELPVGRFKLPSERVQGLDTRVDAVVARLLENEPEARYSKAAELCQALEGLVSSTSLPPGALRAQEELSPVRSRLRTGWRTVRAVLTVLGALVVIFAGARKVFGQATLYQGATGKLVLGSWLPRWVAAGKPWPANTDGDLFVSSMMEDQTDGKVRLRVDFVKGQEELNAHAGTWKLENGQLHVIQGGDETTDGQLIPRAYLAHRYFSSDDFSVEALMSATPLDKGYLQEPDAQHYAELSYRVTGLQVSVFAIPEAGMRLGWKYTTPEGEIVAGNSAQDVESLVQDETPVPSAPFRVKLQLKKKKNGVDVTAYLNGSSEPFAFKFLEGFQGRSAKVAVGCRNLVCTFDDVVVRGLQTKKSAHTNKVAETQQE